MKRIRLKFKKKPPVNWLMFACYFALCIYAYAQTNRLINELLILVTMLIIIDSLCFFLATKQMSFRVHGEEIVHKYEVFAFWIEMINTGFLPVTYIELVPKKGIRVSLEEEKHVVMMLKSKEKIAQSILYKANLCGLEEIQIEKIILKSIFSFFRKELCLEDHVKVRILPEIVHLEDIQYFDKFLGESQKEYGEHIEKAPLYCEEVGYELKPYVEGDSQKLIHWKLAAYKDELLVRQREHETQKAGNAIFILAPFLLKDEGNEIIEQDKLLTTFVSLASYYLEKVQHVEVAFFQDKKWRYIKIKNTKQLRGLQERLASYESLMVQETINQRSIISSIMPLLGHREGIKAIVLGYWTPEIESFIVSKSEKHKLINIWAKDELPKSLVTGTTLSTWHMDDQFNLKMISDFEMK